MASTTSAVLSLLSLRWLSIGDAHGLQEPSPHHSRIFFGVHRLAEGYAIHSLLHLNPEIVRQEVEITHFKMVLHIGLEHSDRFLIGVNDDQIIDVDANDQSSLL
jgi:hypothetical protein